MIKQCENDAAVRYIWPGKDEAFCCLEHMIGVKRVSDAMGCPVHMHKITPDFVENGWPKCSSLVSEKQPAKAEE